MPEPLPEVIQAEDGLSGDNTGGGMGLTSAE